MEGWVTIEYKAHTSSIEVPIEMLIQLI